MWHYQIKNIYNASMIVEPYLTLIAQSSFGQHQEHARVLVRSKAGSLRVTEL